MSFSWKYLWQSAGATVSGVYRLLGVAVPLVEHSGVKV